jgi:hypothetical protein
LAHSFGLWDRKEALALVPCCQEPTDSEAPPLIDGVLCVEHLYVAFLRSIAVYAEALLASPLGAGLRDHFDGMFEKYGSLPLREVKHVAPAAPQT